MSLMRQSLYNWITLCPRHPDAHSRLHFRAIHLSLSQSEDEVLKIPTDALQTHPQAGVLGAPLEAGQDMYADLQKTYLATNH